MSLKINIKNKIKNLINSKPKIKCLEKTKKNGYNHQQNKLKIKSKNYKED